MLYQYCDIHDTRVCFYQEKIAWMSETWCYEIWPAGITDRARVLWNVKQYGVGVAYIVEDKICTGTECKEIKSSTSDKEGDQVDRKSTVLSTTSGTD